MGLKDDLLAFVSAQSDDPSTKQRDANIIAYYYGLNGTIRPTLRQTAQHFAGLVKFQRVHQIIDKKFRNIVQHTDLPSIQKIIEILETQQFWQTRQLVETLSNAKLIVGSNDVFGLFALMDDLEIKHSYRLYDVNLKPIKKAVDLRITETFIVYDDIVSHLSSIYRKAQRMQAETGMSNSLQLRALSADYPEYIDFVIYLIHANDDAWTKDIDGVLWFLFENRENRILNYTKKVFAGFESCDIQRLAGAYVNAFKHRTSDREYPCKELIETYLSESKYCEIIDGDLYFDAQTTELSTVETAILKFVQLNRRVSYEQIRKHLISEECNPNTIRQYTYYSPFFHRVKAPSSPEIFFELVGATSEPAGIEYRNSSANSRYDEFRNRLLRLDETDEKGIHKRRREQRILKQWLFENRMKEYCGICGRQFTVAALVAAHKKKRTICNPNERRDPNIVMPMCVFGCDFLYEQGHITIKDGSVNAGLPIEHDGPEKERVANVVNRKVDERWLQGPETYFR